MKKIDNEMFSNLFVSDFEDHYIGFYNGGLPNDNIGKFIEKFSSDDLSLVEHKAMDQLLTSRGGSLGSDIYEQHGYWSKKPYGGIEDYIHNFSKFGGLILDPFCGSGSTILVSVALGRNAIGIDLSPAATFISAGYLTGCDPEKLVRNGRKICNTVKNKWPDAYKTASDKKDVDAYIISDTCKCLKCMNIVAIYDLLNIDGETYCNKCKTEKISTRSRNIEWIGEAIVDVVGGKYISSLDTHYRHDEAQKIRNSYLKVEIPETIQKIGRLNTLGINFVGELFSDRAVICLNELREAILEEDANLLVPLLFVFSSILLNSSKMYRVREGGGGGPAGNYFVPSIRKDNNVFNLFESKLIEIARAKLKWNGIKNKGKAILSTQSASNIFNIPPNTIDYIFTDPPYSDKMPYGALNCVWEAWLNFDRQWLPEEIISDNWEAGMRRSVKEMMRVLKPGCFLSLCYHDTSEGTWGLVQDIFAEAGFIVDQSEISLHIDTAQRPMQQQKSDKVIKRDLVINFRKPLPSEVSYSTEITGNEDQKTFNEKIVEIIREYLSQNPGSTKDRVYDEVISRMIRKGELQAHNFEEILDKVADCAEGELGNRWYLKESIYSIIDAAESSKEDTAAEKIRKYIAKCLEKDPTTDGVHYSDVFEWYVHIVKDKPRRPLVEWLLDYFFKTDNGTYRLPITDEETRLRSEGRSKGTQRRIKRYIAFLQQGVAIPDKERPNDSTLIEWIRHCKRSGLYEQGKLLYEKGGLNLDNLPEETMVNVDEDYQVCARMLSRAGGGTRDNKPKRGRRIKT